MIWLVEIYQNKLELMRESGDELADYRNLEEEFLALLIQQRVEECIRNNNEISWGPEELNLPGPGSEGH